MSTAITVIGVGAGAVLSPAAQAALHRADLVVSSVANLDLAAPRDGVERLELGPLAPALERLRRHEGAAVVLASGDPSFFGVARSLTEAGLDVQILPAVSSVATVAALAGQPWDAAVVVSAHGRDLAPALNACRAFPAVAVLTGPVAGPVELARGLDGWHRDLVVAERLGLPGERVTRRPAAVVAKQEPDDFAAPNVVLSLDPRTRSRMRADNQPAAAPKAGWALDETHYDHRDSMITKAEVRAYVVARLRPRLGRLVWDIGAGSGSVGIECAALGSAVICLERDGAAGETITANAAHHQVDVRVVAGVAPGALADLPQPDAAFVGGGGLDVVAAVIARRVPVVVAAFAALDRAVAAHRALRAGGYRVEGTQLSAARLADLPGGSLRLVAANPVVVLCAERTDDPS